MSKLKTALAARLGAHSQVFNATAFVNDLAATAKQADSLVQAGGFESYEVAVSADHLSSFVELAGQFKDKLDEMGFEDYLSAKLDNSGIADAGMKARVSNNVIMSATMAAAAARNEQGYRMGLRSLSAVPASNENTIVYNPVMAGPHGTVSTVPAGGFENYNEKSQRDFRVVSIGYQLEAAKQDHFSETIYPTTVVDAQEGGVVQNVTIPKIIKNSVHKVSGAVFNTEEVNIVEAYRDHTVLNNDVTSIYPIVDPDGENADIFVDDADVGPMNIVVPPGETLTTKPLVFGREIDLIGNSNRNQLIGAQLLGIDDTLDSAMHLKNVYVRLGETGAEQVVKFNTQRLPTSVFTPALTQDSRDANLNFRTTHLILNKDSKTVTGTAQAALTEIANREWTVHLAIRVNGTYSLSLGNGSLDATGLEVKAVYSNDGASLDLTTGDVADMIDLLGDLVAVGYDLDVRFTNTNRRERGDLIQTRTIQFRYPIPMHSPITLPLSTMDVGGPGEVVKVLSVATNIRNSNNAVTRMLNYLSTLRAVLEGNWHKPETNRIEGALGSFIRPQYRHVMLDLQTKIDTIRSKDRWDDVCSTIMNTIRSVLFEMYRDSNIEAAFQTVSGNNDEKPKFILATDVELANYLMTRGDNRTLGAYLKYDVVATKDERFDGKIVVLPTAERAVEGSILNWGQFHYVPTIIADLNISRFGSVSREIAAVPFNLHVNNIPFALEIDVSGLKEVMGESLYNQLPGFNTP